jgi:hypothetical protein
MVGINMRKFFIVGLANSGLGPMRVIAPEAARGYALEAQACVDAAVMAQRGDTLAVVEVRSIYEPRTTVVVEKKLPADVP